MSPTRRQFCAAGVAVTLGGCLGSSGEKETSEEKAEWSWSGSVPVESAVQYHDSSCGCCAEYVAYLKDNEFSVRVEEPSNLAAKKTELSVPEEVRSCHTTVFGEHLVEGHVPLQAIEALFESDTEPLGIALPGMPQHSPGMGPRGDEPLTIYAFEEDGESYEYIRV